ncbi:MAG: hypothetical protein NUV60_00600 [Patescibacteria group bacterium]|nr:hypothetical protein [Patescibacteria group bacterium]
MHVPKIVTNHKWAIVLAVFVALIVSAPQVAFRIQHAHDGIYQGIELLPDNSWPPRVREIMDGHGFGSIYFKEGKSDPYLFQPLGSMTVAYMGEAFGLNINDTLLFARFVLSFVVFLLIYSFVFLLSRSRLVALSGASVFLFADSITNLSGLKSLLAGVSPSNFLNIDLPVNPAMIYIPPFLFLVSFWLFYKKGGYKWGIASAIFLGLNFYAYFYSWTYLYAFGGILVLLYLVQKKWSEAVRIGSVFLGALVMAIPYGINLYRASQYSTFADVGMRQGILFTHAPLFVGIVVVVALLIFLGGFPREDRERYLFGLALLLAPFITMNQQILTGKIMQEAHYHWYFHKPMAVLFVIIIVFYLLSRLKTGWYKQTVAIVMIVSSFALGIFIQVNSFTSNRGDAGAIAIERQKYGPVMDWLNQNATKEDVVLSNDPISYLVTIYTSLNIYYCRADLYSLSATNERLRDILFTLYRLRGVGKEEVQKVFYAERKFISLNLYGIYYRQLSGSYEAIPDEELNRTIALYEETLATPTEEWLKQKMTQYEVNYVIWDKKSDPDWQLQKYPFLHEAAVFGDIVIYQFQK